MSSERKAFKDWFDREAATRLAFQIKKVWGEFDEKNFIEKSVHRLSSLEFQARIRQFSEALRLALPPSIPRALKILVRSLPPAPGNHQVIADGWLQWPVGQFIADYGVPHYEESMAAMLALTQRFTAEFAVRPFIETCPQETFDRFLQWSSHPNFHVRRWCSEGSRPRLPWGRKLHALVKDPSPIWPILEKLKDDPEEYVRRSVANNLNDIGKDHPELVIQCCRRWARAAPPERLWVINRALRTLIKSGNPEALAIMGFGPADEVQATFTVKPSKIRIGEEIEFSLVLANHSPRKQRLIVDYLVHYVRQKGKTGIKVFKWKTVMLEPNQETHFIKKHPMKKTSVRALYPGKHLVAAQINGRVMAQANFSLIQ